ncbi:DUF4261 domain-containing protein [Roseimicrobium sp. ORNL1]|uniref:DUF4261 domain-containing protein n=1 Tax=Roseimicrobium sp. ORNL1 TaxID=2711231 RepID=UPI0013E18E91|nr:DUF4261 domain-containing protein [Roseimicrobium sp. ORNL1]QIF05319.1 DUF4261 domain-containing protein [Roseimicrobium sp. ORNL1]
MVVLFEDAPSLASLRWRLESKGYVVAGMEDENEWPEMSGPAILLNWRPEVNGICIVDITDKPWPDGMGDPKEEPKIFGAWAMGAYGPCTYPGGLQRAVQYAVYPEAQQHAQAHQAFVRVRITYVKGAGKDSKVMPPDYDAQPEVLWLAEVTAALLEVEGALAYFNPGGERLLPKGLLEETLDGSRAQNIPPIQALVTVRNIHVDDTWTLTDTVGMAQLDLQDIEMASSSADTDLEEMRIFPMNMGIYLLKSGAVMDTGHTTEGPSGKIWRAQAREESCYAPPRPVLHWREDDAPPAPEVLNKPVREADGRGRAGDRDVAALAATSGAIRSSSEIPDEEEVMREALQEALAELEKSVKEWMGKKDLIKERAIEWLRTDAFEKYYDDAHVPRWLFCIIAIIKPHLIKELYSHAKRNIFHSRKVKQTCLDLATRGEVWFVSSVIANSQLRRTPDQYLPALVLGAESQTTQDFMLAHIVAEMMADIYMGGGGEGEHPKLAELMSTDEYHAWRRREVPAEETNGVRCFAMDIMLRGDCMPPPDTGFIPVLVMPGKGPVVQIPWHVVQGAPPPMPKAPHQPSPPPMPPTGGQGPPPLRPR